MKKQELTYMKANNSNTKSNTFGKFLCNVKFQHSFFDRLKLNVKMKFQENYRVFLSFLYRLKYYFEMRRKGLKSLSFYTVFALTFLFSFSVSSQCNLANFQVTQINGTCSADAQINVVVPGASTCTGWNAILTLPGGTVLSREILPDGTLNGGPFSSLPAGSYTVHLWDGTTAMQWGSNPIILTTTYVPMTVSNSSLLAPSCSSSLDGCLNVIVNGGIGPFVYTISSTNLNVVDTSANTSMSFCGFAGNETVAFTITDLANFQSGCQTTAAGGGVVPVPSSFSLTPVIRYIKPQCAPNCNAFDFSIRFNDNLNGTSQIARIKMPGNATISVNGGAPQNLTHDFVTTFRYSGGINPGDTYRIRVTDGCAVFDQTYTMAALGTDFNVVTQINSLDNSCNLEYKVGLTGYADLGGNLFRQLLCDNNTITIEQETPVGSGIWTAVPLSPNPSNPLAGSQGTSATNPQVVYDLPGPGTYRYTASDGCRTITRIHVVNPVTIDPLLQHLNVTVGTSVLEGTASIRVTPPALSSPNSPNYPLTVSVRSLTYGDSVVIRPKLPTHTCSADTMEYTIHFPVTAIYNKTGDVTRHNSLNIGDLPPGQYEVEITDKCGNNRIVPITINPSHLVTYNPDTNVIVRCGTNNNSIQFSLNATNINMSFIRMNLSRANSSGNPTGAVITEVGGYQEGITNKLWNNLAPGNYVIEVTQWINYTGNNFDYSAALGGWVANAGTAMNTNSTGRFYRICITIPPYENVTTNVSAATCADGTGVIIANITGGTPVYPVTYTLFANDGVTVIQTHTATNASSLNALSNTFTGVPNGDYIVEFQNQCYTTRSNVNVGVSATSPEIIATNSSICINDSVTLSVPLSISDWDIAWRDINGVLLDTGVNEITVSPNTNTQYIVNYQLTGGIGCATTTLHRDTILIEVLPLPDTLGKIVLNDTICFGGSGVITLVNANAGIIYELYQNGDTLSTRIIETALVDGALNFTVPASLLSFGDNVFHIKTATSGCEGGFLNDSAIVHVVLDTLAPVFNGGCVLNTTLYAGTASCDISVPDFTSSSQLNITDNCSSIATGTITVTQNPIAGTVLGVGTHTVWIIATDYSSNADSCSFVLTVNDTLPPVFNGGCITNTTLYTNASSCDISVPDFTSSSQLNITDNCGSIATGTITVTQNPIAGTVLGIGTHTIWIIATDNSLNADSCSFILTVSDTLAPVISGCPSNIIVSNDAGSCEAIVTWTTTPTATDNCGAPTLTSSHASGATFPVGTTTVTYTATDASGNVDSCSFTVTVTDSEFPVVSITGLPLMIFCEGSPVTWQETITDNCGIASTVSSHNSGDIFPVGTTTVTYTVTDIHGNVTIDSFNVIVNPAPVVGISGTSKEQTICSNVSINLTVSAPVTGYTYTWYQNGVQVGTGTSYSVASPQISNSGLYTVIAENASGCTSDVDSIKINVISCGIVIPEIFSPNGDASNEFFVVDGLNGYPNTKIWIHNRWGTEVFQSDNYQNNWDGKSQSKLNVSGDDLPEGTYFYIMQLGAVSEQSESGEIYKGYVYLKR